MDILDILLDILLKPPQPLMGLFLSNAISQYADFDLHENYVQNESLLLVGQQDN